ELEPWLDERPRVRAGAHGVAVHRDEERYRPELAAVAEEALPVEAAVLRDGIGRPVVDLVERPQRDGIAAEAAELLRRERAPHLDVRGADGHEPDGDRRLPEVVVEHRHGLVQPT